MLNIGNNRLKALPTSLGNLFNLEELVVNSNQLVEIPSFISQLKGLTVFIANSNIITTIAEEFCGNF